MTKDPKIGGTWGPAVDPAPGFGGFGGFGLSHQILDIIGRIGGTWGAVVDPAPSYQLLDKAKVAAIQVRQLDLVIDNAERQLEILKLQRDMLKEEYDIK